MRKHQLYAAAFATFGLAGCQTAAEHDTQIQSNLSARLSAWEGRTIAQFVAGTGMTPESAYPVSGGRVFVFHGNPVVLSLPAMYGAPAVSNVSQCQLLVQARRSGDGHTADDWTIVGTSRTGPCRNLPV